MNCRSTIHSCLSQDIVGLHNEAVIVLLFCMKLVLTIRQAFDPVVIRLKVRIGINELMSTTPKRM